MEELLSITEIILCLIYESIIEAMLTSALVAGLTIWGLLLASRFFDKKKKKN
tara:strand:- start:48 stop:203 length:156 start_codon:yes stop_codon:yes gene_type:complete